MLSQLIIQILSNALAIYVAAQLVPGFHLEQGGLAALLTAAFVFGMINFFVKPVLKILSLPVIFLSLGLFTILINIAMLFLLDYLMPAISIDGFAAAFWAMLVISSVNCFISFFSKN